MVAVLLSAQATGVSVNQATRKLYPNANKPAVMILLGFDAVKDRIKTIGRYNSKAENMTKTYTISYDKYGREIPRTRDALEALRGVGRKTPTWF